jgi:outer membrane protein OmpA-like peptidoglycan-associated protein
VGNERFVIWFDQSDYKLRPVSRRILDDVAQALRQHPDRMARISGHTDNVGSATLNQGLSELRAIVSKIYLFEKGIAENRFRYIGFGGRKPIAANDAEENKAKNRRVEIELVSQ